MEHITTAIKYCVISFFLMTHAQAQSLEEVTAFDIYLGEKYMGIALADYNVDGFVKFHDVDGLVKLLKLKENSGKVMPLVTGVIPKTRVLENLGSVEVNADAFQITFKLAEQFFSSKTEKKSTFLKQTPHAPGLKVELRGGYNQTPGFVDTKIVGLDTYLTYEDYWLNYSSLFQEGTKNSYETEDLTLNRVFGQFQVSVGYLRSSAIELMPIHEIAGIQLKTSAFLVEGSDDLRGSKLEVFVPTRSKVSFYRDGVYIDKQVLQVGKQFVDTARFPQGSYPLDIVIETVDGKIIKDRKYFAKSGLLSPRGFPQYQLNLGRIRVSDDITQEIFYSGTLSARVVENADMRLGIYAADEKPNVVFGFRAYFNDIFMRGATSFDDVSNTGLSFGVSGGVGPFSINFDYERSDYVEYEEADEDEFDIYLATVLEDLQEENLARRERFSAQIGFNFGNSELRYRYLSLRDQDEIIQDFHGASWRYRILESGVHSLSTDLSYTHNKGAETYLAALNWQFRAGRASFQNKLLGELREDQLEYGLLNAIHYNDIHSRSGLGVKANLQSHLRVDESEKWIHYLTGNYEYGGAYGRVGLNSALIRDKDEIKTSRSITMGTTLSLNADGGFGFGPDGLGESAVIVNIENFDDSAISEILVDGQILRRIQGSQRVTLGVSPYQKYRISIQPSVDSPLVKYDNSIKELLLFPGHIEVMNFKVERVFVVLGFLENGTGEPLSHYSLKNSQGEVLGFTEEDGSFQIELSEFGDVAAEKGGERCKFSVDSVEKVEYFLDLDRVKCI